MEIFKILFLRLAIFEVFFITFEVVLSYELVDLRFRRAFKNTLEFTGIFKKNLVFEFLFFQYPLFLRIWSKSIPTRSSFVSGRQFFGVRSSIGLLGLPEFFHALAFINGNQSFVPPSLLCEGRTSNFWRVHYKYWT